MARSIIPDSLCLCKSCKPRKSRRQQLAAPLLPPAIPAEGKHIVYERETGDYAMYLDAQLIGFARTHLEAETSLDELVDEIQRHTRATTADMEAEADALRESGRRHDQDLTARHPPAPALCDAIGRSAGPAGRARDT
jgi:hypothetical protein